MIVNVNKRILIVGLGLIGGSYARINDLMWSELFIENKAALLGQMNLFSQKFNELKNMLENEDVDSMRKMMRHSTERRALFDKK